MTCARWMDCPNAVSTLANGAPVMRCALTGKHPDDCVVGSTGGEHAPGIVERLRGMAAEIDCDWAADIQEGGNAPRPVNTPHEAADLISELVGALNLMFSNFAGLLNDDDYARVEAILESAVPQGCAQTPSESPQP